LLDSITRTATVPATDSELATHPPAIGAQVRIFYDPNNPCQSLDYDPASRKRSDLTWLVVFSAVFSLAVGSAAWDFARQR